MTCPICSGSRLSHDASVVEKRGKKVILQGKVYAVIRPDEAHYSPFADHFTVSLYPRKGRVKYLKFKTQDEVDRWTSMAGQRIRCEGCLHEADGREVVFDVRAAVVL